MREVWASLAFDPVAVIGLVLLTLGLWWLAPWLSLTVLARCSSSRA